MNVWPAVVDVRVLEAERTRFRMWLPLFLLWPLMLVLAVLALVATIVVDALLLVAGQRYHYYSALLMGSLGALCETRGMKIYIEDDETTVDVAVW